VRVHANGDGKGKPDCVTVDVRDTGCGMSSSLTSRVLSPFFTTRIRGHGLGLSVAAGVVRAHQGKLRIDSTPGEGTTVRMSIPAAEQK